MKCRRCLNPFETGLTFELLGRAKEYAQNVSIPLKQGLRLNCDALHQINCESLNPFETGLTFEQTTWLASDGGLVSIPLKQGLRLNLP